ncbi:MAG: carbohydrate kinase [Chitinivibrionales bacterium]|nr:carbohydrate kinase [Chitinivibrionales bacterium]
MHSGVGEHCVSRGRFPDSLRLCLTNQGGNMSNYHIAVIDVGKTNKKVLIFDDKLRLLDSVYKNFDEYVEGKTHFEDVENMTAWFKESLKGFSSEYDIKALSITTHGATAMCIDKKGKLATPPVAYTTETDESFQEAFYSRFGSREELQQKTATAQIGDVINIGKKVYFLQKNYPDQFKEVETILNYPQYFGYVFTGKKGAEPTYVGCHTYLFDFAAKHYSELADKLGIRDKLPPKISKSWEVLGTISEQAAAETGLSTNCVVTMGIHDSNSSLLPYIVQGYKDFVLNSTGTWCVAMHPTADVKFAEHELGKLVFYNLNAFFEPVKTSIFMGGLEFETYTRLLWDINKTEHYPEPDYDLYRKIISEKKLFILPSVVKGTGIFPDAKPCVIENGVSIPLENIQNGTQVPSFFTDFHTAWATMSLSLAIQTKAALNMVGFAGKGAIFTEGGFRKNKEYNALLTSVYPDASLYLTNMEEATAFGAAILGKAALDKTTPMETNDCFDIKLTPVDRVELPGMQEYVQAFLERVG